MYNFHFLHFEDYANITDLIIETLEQLVLTGSEVFSQDLTAKTL